MQRLTRRPTENLVKFGRVVMRGDRQARASQHFAPHTKGEVPGKKFTTGTDQREIIQNAARSQLNFLSYYLA